VRERQRQRVRVRESEREREREKERERESSARQNGSAALLWRILHDPDVWRRGTAEP
jgi:hypothetical protein